VRESRNDRLVTIKGEMEGEANSEGRARKYTQLREVHTESGSDVQQATVDKLESDSEHYRWSCVIDVHREKTIDGISSEQKKKRPELRDKEIINLPSPRGGDANKLSGVRKRPARMLVVRY